jgi:hypothetical protein
MTDEDPLAPARGVVNGCAIGAILWAAILGAAWLLLSAPAYGITRGDNRTAQGGVPFFCTAPHQTGTATSVCVSGRGCEYIDEGYHGPGSAPGGLCDSDDIEYPGAGPLEGDVWTDTHVTATSRSELYSLGCHTVLDAGAWVMDWHPIESDVLVGYAHDYLYSTCDVPGSWQGVAGKTYRVWLSELHSVDQQQIHLTMTCGTIVRTWDSNVGGELPMVALTSAQPCTLAMRVVLQQNTQLLETALRASAVRAGVNHSPTPTQGGCGIGPGLALLLPLLRKLRRS